MPVGIIKGFIQNWPNQCKGIIYVRGKWTESIKRSGTSSDKLFKIEEEMKHSSGLR